MKYMLMLFEHVTWEQADQADIDAEMEAHGAFSAWCAEQGIGILGAEALQDPGTAVTVDRTGDVPVVTDGAFAELRESLGGYYIIDARDLDQAVEAARRCPLGSSTEVRPIFEI